MPSGYVPNPALIPSLMVDPAFNQGVGVVTGLVADRARSYAPGSIGDQIDWIVAAAEGLVESNHPASVFVEFGTAPHIIRPVSAEALAGAGFGPVELVMHPGSAPNPFLRRAAVEFGILGLA